MARRTKLSENDHEREFFKYLPSLVFQSHATHSIPISSADNTLTALAQLGALRLRTSRSFISLFDKSHQYILAEATPTLSLQDDGIHDRGDALWYGTTVLHRHASPCSLLVEQRMEAYLQGQPDPDSVTVIPDLLEENRFKATDFAAMAPAPRFYAAVPLYSPRGAVVGSYCVLDDCPRARLDPAQIRFLEDMAATVMSHLVLSRMREEYRQGERMIRGVGSFVEGRSTLRNWRATTGDDELSYEPSRRHYGGEGQLDKHQQSLQGQDYPSHDYFSIARPDAHGTIDSKSRRNPDRTVGSCSPLEQLPSPVISKGSLTASPTVIASGAGSPALLDEDIHDIDPNNSVTTPGFPAARVDISAPKQTTTPTLSRAANIIRECLEIEGTVFYQRTDARSRVQSDSGSSNSGTCTETTTGDDNSADTDDSRGSKSLHEKCKVLAHSESHTSSINNESPSSELSQFLGTFLDSLYRRYPNGKIFHFDVNGSPSSGSSGDESPVVAPKGAQPEVQQQPNSKRPRKMDRKKNGSKSKARDGAMLLKYFPGARSIGFFPLWDSRQEKWFAGGFIWTKKPNRSFTVEGHMSFCKAIGSAIMADVVRLDALKSDRAKTELLGSISHELRSPLHGILGSVELLGDLPQTEFQADMVRSIEICGRTLLDTIEQLLDFSKINHLAQQKKQMMFRNSMRAPASEARLEDPATRLDVITEEVVTAVSIGHNAQSRASLRFEKDPPNDNAQRTISSSTPPAMSGDSTRMGDSDLAIDLNIDKSMDMAFHTNPGAWRRIVMNLFANSLKYTAAGHIKISLSARPAFKKQHGLLHRIHLTVTDTGIGISPEYLRDGLFKPFSQENNLASGTGLGMSIVKQIVDAHNGKIRVKSTQGVGTRISVSMCMEADERITQGKQDYPISAQVGSVSQHLQGRTACLLDCQSSFEAEDRHNGPGDDIAWAASLKKTCRDWFGLTLCSESELKTRQCSIFFVLDPESAQTGPTLSKIRSLSANSQSKTKGILFVIFRSLEASQRFLAATPMLADSWFIQCIIQPFGIQKLASSIARGLDLQSCNAISQVIPDASSSTSDEVDRAASSQESLEYPVSSPFSQGLKTPPSEVEFSPAPLSAPNEPSGYTNPGLPVRTFSSETATPERLENNSTKHQGAQQSSPHCGHERGADPSILIVDDNAINVKILATHLKRRKMHFLTAQNGQEALDIYTSSPTACRTILMDISMPVMDGLTSTRAIRALEKQQGLTPSTIVIVTGLADANAQQETQASGADAYIAKPVRLKELDKVLAELEDSRKDDR